MLLATVRRRLIPTIISLIFLMIPLALNILPKTAAAHMLVPRNSYNLVVNANQDLPGLDTGIDLTVGGKVAINASGEAAFGTGDPQDCSTTELTIPDGHRITQDGTICTPKMDPNVVLPSAPVGELIANIGSSGWFAVGSSDEFPVATSGRLFLLYNDVSGEYGNNSGSYQVTINYTPPPLGGTWISPKNNFTLTGNTLHFAAHAYGGAGVDHVNFTGYWPGVSHGWYVACSVYNPQPGSDIYWCNWNLSPSIPNAQIKVSFDVYDKAGGKILSPNGIRQGVINRPIHSELLAPMPSGTQLKIVHGYNDPLPGEYCPPPGPNRADHCMNQAYGLDFVPIGSATDIIAPAPGTVAWMSKDCLGLRLDLGDVNLTICHFAIFKTGLGIGDRVARGDFLGTWIGNIHLSVDDRYHNHSPDSGCSPSSARTCRPVPFNAGYFTIEGISFDPGFDQNHKPIRDQYDGSTIVSTNPENK